MEVWDSQLDLFQACYWNGWTERLLIDCDGSWSIPPGEHVRPNVDLDSLYFNLVTYGSVTCDEEINLTHLVSGLWVSSFITSIVDGGNFHCWFYKRNVAKPRQIVTMTPTHITPQGPKPVIQIWRADLERLPSYKPWMNCLIETATTTPWM